MIDAAKSLSPIVYAVTLPLGALLLFGGALVIDKSRHWIEDMFFNSILAFDCTIGFSLAALLYFFLHVGGFMPTSLEFFQKDGTAAYGALLSSFAALLGFAVTILSIVCTVIPSLRIAKYITKEQYYNFWQTFTLTIRTLGACTFTTLLAMFLNRSEHAREGFLFLVVLIICITVPGLIRSALTLEILVKAVGSAPFDKRNRPPNPSVQP